MAMAAETIAAAAAATLSTRRPLHSRTAASFQFRATPRLPGAVVTSASGRLRCKAKAKAHEEDDSKTSAAIDDQLVLDVAESTWDDLVLGGCESLVLVEFWAPWCGPCRMMHPIIEDVAKAYAGRLRCLKLNTDKNQQVATRYGIRSIPTVLIFKNGERKETVIGAVTDTTLTTTVERFL